MSFSPEMRIHIEDILLKAKLKELEEIRLILVGRKAGPGLQYCE